jgi:2-polyprenyl-3-methyl-5-hydroxy-6-metoxy-1,4-benzoquinol methylase
LVRKVTPEAGWPASWRHSYPYDLVEVFGSSENAGYRLAYATRRSSALNALTALLPPPARLLDVAAAQGNFSLALAEAGYQVTWNDLRADLADYVKLKHEKGSIEFVPGNVFDLDFREPYDAVLATEIIEHVAHPDRFLKRLGDLTKPGGIVVLTTPNGRFLFNRLPKFSDCRDPAAFESVQFGPNSDAHIFLIHPEEITAFASSAGLDVERLELHTTPLTAGHLKLRHLIPLLGEARVLRWEARTHTLPQSLLERLMIHQTAVLRKPLDA